MVRTFQCPWQNWYLFHFSLPMTSQKIFALITWTVGFGRNVPIFSWFSWQDLSNNKILNKIASLFIFFYSRCHRRIMPVSECWIWAGSSILFLILMQDLSNDTILDKTGTIFIFIYEWCYWNISPVFRKRLDWGR